ncbi:MAG: zinc-ribbon domain-containing protein [Pyrinomonadaceae bacterium]
MIIRCDNCSVSLQLDESKVPSGRFTVRCPRCQNMLRATKSADGQGTSPVAQLEQDKPEPAAPGSEGFAARESEFQINAALRTLLTALQKGAVNDAGSDDAALKPRRVLLCLGSVRDAAAKVLTDAGYKVYLADTPAQANERMRDSKTEIVIFSPDFATEYGGAAIIQQRANALYSSERRRLFLVSIEDNGTTMNAHEAFLRNLNLIVNSGDVRQLPLILNRALNDYNELYHYFNRAAELQPI